jgi:hypothetical protein
VTDPAALRRKALSALREGRVTVRVVTLGGTITATVRSSRKDTDIVHVIDGITATGNWHCTCQSVFAPPCAHISAVRMVTDHGGAA